MNIRLIAIRRVPWFDWAIDLEIEWNDGDPNDAITLYPCDYDAKERVGGVVMFLQGGVASLASIHSAEYGELEGFKVALLENADHWGNFLLSEKDASLLSYFTEEIVIQ